MDSGEVGTEMNWKAILGAVAAAVLVDLQAFYTVKKKNADAKFRLDLLALRALTGFLTGLTVGG